MNNFAARIIAVALFAGTLSVHGQILSPIAISFDTSAGETLEELGLPTDPNENSAATLSSSGDYISLQGDNPEDPSAGLPDDGMIVSTADPAVRIISFQLGPYSEPDVLEGNGTVILETPGSYSYLAFLVNSMSTPRHSAPATFTLNFSDGTFETLSTVENVPYWQNGVPGVANGAVALSTNAAYEAQEALFDDTPVNLDEYAYQLLAEDAAKTLVSIDVNANSGDLFTYAISGLDPPTDLPEPPTWSLLAIALVGLGLVRRLFSAERA